MLQVSWFIMGAIYALVQTYYFRLLTDNKKFEIRCGLLVLTFIFSVIYCCIQSYDVGWVKPFLTYFVLFLFLKIYYKDSLIITLIGITVLYLIIFLSEFAFDFITIFIFNGDINKMLAVPIGYLFCNLMIMGISFFLIKIKWVKKFAATIISWYTQNDLVNLIVLLLLGLGVVTFTLYENIRNSLSTSSLLLINICSIGVFTFIIGYFKEKSTNNKISKEYDQLLEYVTTYEKLVEEKSKAQHEHKNQLILIRGMLPKNNVKISKYISELLEETEIEYNYSWMNKLKNLPKGGLKGLIYYKIQIMEQKGIKVFVETKENVQKKKIFGKNNENLQDVSKVLGVYIDNAIEAASQVKDKFIVIEVYYEKKEVIFKISNTYEKGFDLTMIDEEGYSTKGKGKGYGLSLAKDILAKNKNIRQKKEFNGRYYVQYLFIKVL